VEAAVDGGEVATAHFEGKRDGPLLPLGMDIDVQQVGATVIVNLRRAVDEAQPLSGTRPHVDCKLAHVQLRDAEKGLVQGVRIDAAALLHRDIAEQPCTIAALDEFELEPFDDKLVQYPAPLPDAAGHVDDDAAAVEEQHAVRGLASRRGNVQGQPIDLDHGIEADESSLQGFELHRQAGDFEDTLFNKFRILGDNGHELPADADIGRHENDCSRQEQAQAATDHGKGRSPPGFCWRFHQRFH